MKKEEDGGDEEDMVLQGATLTVLISSLQGPGLNGAMQLVCARLG